MKSRMTHNALMTLSLFGLILIAGTLERTYAQSPCVVTGSNTWTNMIRNAIANLEAQGASVTCDSSNMYVTMPNGLYFRLSAPEDAAVSLFSFNPVDGRTSTWYVLDGGAGPTLFIEDSVYGWINAGDGWFDIFYPIGNPYSAAIQNPIQNSFLAAGSNPDPWGFNSTPQSRPAPFQSCCTGY